MIIIFAIFLTTVSAQQNKYNNLLPNEKQEVLENVAKRAMEMEPVVSNGTIKESIEVTDAQLNEHSSFVQSLIEQEAAAFIARKNMKAGINDDSKYGLQTKSEIKDVKNKDTTETSTIKNLNEEKGKSTLDSKTQMKNSDSVESNKETQKLKIGETADTPSTAFINNSQYETASEPDIPLSVTVTSFIQDVNNVPTVTTTGTKTQIFEYDSANNPEIIYLITKRSNHFQKKLNASEFYTQDSSNSTLKSFLTDESTTGNSGKETITNENADLPTTLNSQIFIITTQNTAQVTTATSENYSAVTKERLQTIPETSTFTPILTTRNMKEEQSTKKPKKNEISKTIKQPENDNLISYVASKALENIKHELESKKIGNVIANEIETNRGDTNYYRIYEIPWPIKRRDQPFLRSQEPVKDQPYFVPVYKYSPNFAYYNPRNRHGPNEVEDNSIELDTNLREGNNDKHIKVEPSEFILQLNNELRKFGIRKRKKKTNAHDGTQSMLHKEKKRKEKDDEENDEEENEEEEDKTRLEDFINSEENTSNTKNSHSLAKRTTHAPPSNAYESSGNCQSTEKEGSEATKEGFDDDKQKGEGSKEGLNHSQQKGEGSKEGLNHNQHKGEGSKEGSNHNQHKGEGSKEGLNGNQHKGEGSKEGLNGNQHKGEASKEGLNGNQHKGEASKEGINDEKNGKTSKERLKHGKKKGHTIAEIIKATDEKDVFTNLAKLQTLDIPLLRSNVESKVNIYMNVLNDLILEDNKSLKQYDWLMTTVQIQTALSKILRLIKRMRQSKQLYPADLQILRYMVFLYNLSLEIKKEDNKLAYKLRKRGKLLPRNKKKRKNKLLKEKGLINRVWLYLRTPLADLDEDFGVNNLYEFLINVQDGLFDLHEAIRHIADVAKFDRQNWYGNLKQLYLNTDEKQLRELLLHLIVSRLFDLVEHSCKHSLDHDFVEFVKTNKKDAKRIVQEMIFINDIVHDIIINKE